LRSDCGIVRSRAPLSAALADMIAPMAGLERAAMEELGPAPGMGHHVPTTASQQLVFRVQPGDLP
jgi:hypothetical protein